MPNIPQSVKRSLTIVNRRGLHARAAAKFVAMATPFNAEITLQFKDSHANGKSIMGLMMLAAAQGSVLEMTADGLDAESAVSALQALVANGFDETE